MYVLWTSSEWSFWSNNALRSWLAICCHVFNSQQLLPSCYPYLLYDVVVSVYAGYHGYCVCWLPWLLCMCAGEQKHLGHFT